MHTEIGMMIRGGAAGAALGCVLGPLVAVGLIAAFHPDVASHGGLIAWIAGGALIGVPEGGGLGGFAGLMLSWLRPARTAAVPVTARPIRVHHESPHRAA